MNDVRDSTGKPLKDGDKVKVIKDLKIKGLPRTIKKGEVVRNIHLTDDETEIECRMGKDIVVLSTNTLSKV